jgi:hypothetical protein
MVETLIAPRSPQTIAQFKAIDARAVSRMRARERLQSPQTHWDDGASNPSGPWPIATPGQSQRGGERSIALERMLGRVESMPARRRL